MFLLFVAPICHSKASDILLFSAGTTAGFAVLAANIFLTLPPIFHGPVANAQHWRQGHEKLAASII